MLAWAIYGPARTESWFGTREFGHMFSLAYVILPVSDRLPAEAIRA